MALGSDYADQDCALARALEVVGERWTMLILRDCFFGVRRFTDFQTHLGISRAVLTQRLSALVDAGVLARQPHGGREEYVLTAHGRALWPALYALTRWGGARDGGEPRRIFSHARCAGDLDGEGRCPRCGVAPPPDELQVRPGPALRDDPRTDPVSQALRVPQRLLRPLPVRVASPPASPTR